MINKTTSSSVLPLKIQVIIPKIKNNAEKMPHDLMFISLISCEILSK
jgi:hypothetical protein